MKTPRPWTSIPRDRRAIAAAGSIAALAAIAFFLTGPRAALWPLGAAIVLGAAAATPLVAVETKRWPARLLALFVGVALLAWAGSRCVPAGTDSVLKIAAFLAFGYLSTLWAPGERRAFRIVVVAAAAWYAAGALSSIGNWSVAGGLPRNPQYKALWLAGGAMILLPTALRREPVRPALRAGAAALGLAFAAALLALRSRGGLVALLIGTGVILHRRFGPRGPLALALALSAAAALVPAPWAGALLKTGDPFAWSRLSIWSAALAGILDRPLLGWGPGLFADLYAAHRPPFTTGFARFDHDHSFAHNEYLQLAAEYGAPALAIAVAFGALYARRHWRAWAAERAAFLAATAAFCLFNFPFYAPADLLLIAGFAFEGPEGKTAWARPAAWRWGFGLSAALSVAVFLAGRDPLSGPIFARTDLEARLSAADRDMHGDGGDASIDRAETALKSLLERWPDRAPAAHALGHLYAEHARRPREAALWLSRALALAPTRATWWMELAAVQSIEGSWSEALESARNALRLEPEYAGAQLMMARALNRLGDPAEAERFLAPLRAPWSPPDGLSGYATSIARRDAEAVRLESALARLRLGRPGEALAMLQRPGLPLSPDALGLEIGARLALRDRPGARRAWAVLAARWPTSPAARALEKQFAGPSASKGTMAP